MDRSVVVANALGAKRTRSPSVSSEVRNDPREDFGSRSRGLAQLGTTPNVYACTPLLAGKFICSQGV